MIKGVNRAVIEVNDTGNEYFEKAIFFIRSSHTEDSQKNLEKEAKKYIESSEKTPFTEYFDLKEDRKRKKRLFMILGGYLLLLGAVILFIVLH